MQKHPNYEFIVAFVEGKEVEFASTDLDDNVKWFNVKDLETFSMGLTFRIKPKTRMINGFEVPFAMDKEPGYGNTYFYPDVTGVEYHFSSYFNSEWDKKNFERGLCFSNKEDAIAVCKAMLGIDPNS